MNRNRCLRELLEQALLVFLVEFLGLKDHEEAPRFGVIVTCTVAHLKENVCARLLRSNQAAVTSGNT